MTGLLLPVLVLLCAQAASGAPSDAPGPRPAERESAAEAARHRWALVGDLHLEPRGVFVVNAAYNRGTLFPGSFVVLALPPAVSRPQFFISPQNTVLGFKLAGLSLGDAQISGALDVNLRSASPLRSGNTISPQFYDVHIQLETGRFRAFVGQFPDVLLPFVPDTINSFPTGYVPGAIGYARPQLRGDLRLPVCEQLQFTVQGSLNQPIQTFDLDDELAGRQAGLPDVQGRVAFGSGAEKQPWERPFEVGLGGHLGRRRVTAIQDLSDTMLTTWSAVGDLRARLPTGTQLKGRIWWGAVLGDYAGAIFQSVNTETRGRIRARGGWAEVQQRLGDRWRVAALYGRDDPRDDDLAPGSRRLNHAALLNTFWDVSKTVGLGAEVGRWSTSYGSTVGVNRAWRGDLLGFLRF